MAGPAEAGCSHYVRNASPRLSEAITLGVPGNHQEPTDTIESSSRRPARRVPCTGALCSSQPAPASSATLIDLKLIGNWAILSAQSDIANPATAPLPDDQRVSLPMPNGIPIDHPPRLR
jgi:hypothetical protein